MSRDMKDDERDTQFASTLAKGLDILRCFTPDEPVLSNKQLSVKTGLAKPTISRFTYTLVKLGYLQVCRDSNRYRLGSAVISLGYPLLACLSLRQIARGPMNDLAAELGCSVSMGIRDRLNIVYVETSRGRSLLSPQFSDVGRTTPMVGSSIGGAYLSACSAAEREAIINEFKVKQPDVWERHGEAVARHLQEYKEFGFCTNSEGRHGPDVVAVGVPLRRSVDGELTVFNCVLTDPTHEMDLVTEVGPRLRAAVHSLEYRLRSFT